MNELPSENETILSLVGILYVRISYIIQIEGVVFLVLHVPQELLVARREGPLAGYTRPVVPHHLLY